MNVQRHVSDERRAIDPVFLTNEFASVRLSIDRTGHTPRLLVEDVEDGASVLIDPLELASFCQADEMDRINWLLVGQYTPPPPSERAGAMSSKGQRP